MGDREIKQFNRVLFARFGNRTQELHAARLRGEIKSVIDTSPPHSYAHAHANDHRRRQTRQKWADEQARIEYENMLLLTKMRTIMSETQNKQFIPVGAEGSAQGGSQSMLLGSGAAQREGELSRGSLNREARIREMRRILHENDNLLSRIQSRPPTYNIAEWERHHLLKEKQLASMGRFQYRSSTVPPTVMQELRTNKPLKRYGTARFPVTNSASTGNLGRALSADGGGGGGAGAGGRAGGRGFVFDGDEALYGDDPSASSSSSSTPAKAWARMGSLSAQGQGQGRGHSPSPHRVHHLPPKGAEEKQSMYSSASAGKLRAASSSSATSPKKKQLQLQQQQQQHGLSKSASLGSRARSRLALQAAAAAEPFPPVEIEMHLENVASHLVAPSAATVHQEEAQIVLPRVILYVRNAITGEYVPLSEVDVEACVGRSAATGFSSSSSSSSSYSFRGSASIPGIDSSPAALEAGADRRVRIAVFAPSDPAFTMPPSRSAALSTGTGFLPPLRVPVDNTHLLGEARFSLAHFLTYPKSLYKLKVLKHGLPIAGPAFATQQPLLAAAVPVGVGAAGAPAAGLSRAEVERRRALPEAILVLRHSNRPEPLGERDMAQSHRPSSEEACVASQEEAQRQQQEEEEEQECPDLQLKFAATGGGLAHSGSGGPSSLALFVFAASGSSSGKDGSGDSEYDEYEEEQEQEQQEETLVGHSECAGDGGASQPLFHHAVALGQWGCDPSRTLRLALYETVPGGDGTGEDGDHGGGLERGTLVGEVRLTVGDLFSHIHNAAPEGEGHAVWRLPLSNGSAAAAAAADADADAAAGTSDPDSSPQAAPGETDLALLLRVEDTSKPLSSQEQWAAVARSAQKAELGQAWDGADEAADEPDNDEADNGQADSGDADASAHSGAADQAEADADAASAEAEAQAEPESASEEEATAEPAASPAVEAAAASSDPDPALERLVSFFLSARGRSLWTEGSVLGAAAAAAAAAAAEEGEDDNGGPELEELGSRLLRAVEGDENFLYSYFDAALLLRSRYAAADLLVGGVGSGAAMQRSARDAIRAHLSARDCTLLPHVAGGGTSTGDAEAEAASSSLSDDQVSEMMSHADLPLSPLAPLCAANRDEALQRLGALQAKGLTFGRTLHLAAAMRKEGKDRAMATAAAAAALADADDAAGPSGQQQQQREAAAIKIQSLQRGRAARQRIKKRKAGADQPNAHDSAAASPEEHAAATRIQAVQRGRTARAKQKAPAADPAADVEVDLGPSAAQHAAARRIQAVQRGRSVRAKKKKHAASNEEQSQSKREGDEQAPGTADPSAPDADADAAKAAAAEAEEQQAAAAKALAEQEEAAAAAKAAAEKQAAAAEQAAAAAAAAAAKALAAEKEHASLLAAEAAAAAAQAAALSKKALADAETELLGRTWTVRMLLAAKNLPTAPASKGPALAGSCHPMVAVYVKDTGGAEGSPDDAGSDFTFLAQTERVEGSTSPLFAEAVVLEGCRGAAQRQLMFSVYNVGNEEEIGEDDVVGTALLTQRQLLKLVARVHAGAGAGGDFEQVALPIVHEGVLLPDATLIIVSLAYELQPREDEAADGAAERAEGASAAPDADADAAEEDEDEGPVVIPEGDMGVWVSLKDLLLPSGSSPTCNALAALYTKDQTSANFNYHSQTSPVRDSTSPVFTRPLVVAMPAPAAAGADAAAAAAADTSCMLNVYNHQGDEVEVSDASALGACLFSLRRLMDAPAGALRVPLVKDGAIRGQVILKRSADALSVVPSRPASAATVQPKSSSSTRPPSSSPKLAVYDLTLSCSSLPLRPGKAATDLASPMLALYAQDPATDEFGYLGQTEKKENTNSPQFDAKIRIDEKTGGGPDGDRALMMMVYDVVNEEDIQEDDQIGTCALTWKFLKDQATATKSSVTLPLLDNEGEQHPTATITVAVHKVQ